MILLCTAISPFIKQAGSNAEHILIYICSTHNSQLNCNWGSAYILIYCTVSTVDIITVLDVTGVMATLKMELNLPQYGHNIMAFPSTNQQAV